MKYDLQKSIAYRITIAASKINKTINNRLKPHGIAVEQRATLEIIKFERNVNQTTISKFLRKDKTTISRSLNSLEKKGFITKTEIEDDKRNKKVELTRKGELILEDTTHEIISFRESFNSKLTEDEIIMFFKIMDKLEL